MTTFSGYLGFWLALMSLGIANGVLRESTYGRLMPELRAHQLSTVTLMLLSAVAVWLLAQSWRPPDTPGQAVLIGGSWLLLTLAFEFLFGRYVAGHSWQRLLQDYNLAAGRVWPLFLVWIALLPSIVASIHRQG